MDCYWLVIDRIEVWSIWLNKTGFLLSYGCVNTTVWMHHVDTNQKHREKARWEIYKNAVCSFKRILVVTPHKTTAAWPLASHLKNKVRGFAWHCWRGKDELISDILLWSSTHRRASVGQWVRNYLHQLCADTGCFLEDLLWVMDNMDGCRERVREIYTVSLVWFSFFI